MHSSTSHFYLYSHTEQPLIILSLQRETASSMLTKLPPELVKRLIDHCLDTGDTFGRVDKDAAISNQRRLVRLSLVCKVSSLCISDIRAQRTHTDQLLRPSPTIVYRSSTKTPSFATLP